MPWSLQVKRRVQRLAALVNADLTAVEAAVDRLVDLALAWESTGGLRPLSGVAEGLTGGPEAGVSGLRPCSAPRRRSPPRSRPGSPSCPRRRGRCSSTSWPPAARRPPTAPGTRCCPRTPRPRPRSCCPAGCWCRAAPARVVVPGEVGVALRGGRTTVEPRRRRPGAGHDPRDRGSRSTASAAGAAFEAVRRLELLLDLWGAEPPAALRSGGLGVRDLKATATALHLDEPTVALLVETAPRPPACSRPRPTPPATRSGCPPTWSTPGCCGRRPSAGRGWPAPGWTARGCPAWSARATPPASRGTRWLPSWPACTWPRPGAMTLAALAGAARRASAWPPGTGVPSVRGAAALAAAAPAADPRRPGAVDADRGRRAGGHRAGRAGVVRPRPAGRRGRDGAEGAGRAAARARRPRAAPGRPHRGRARAAGVAAGPAAPAGGRRGVAGRGDGLPLHARARYAARSTPAGPRSSCTSSSARCRGRRCRSR